MAHDEDEEDRRIGRMFKRMRKDEGIVRIGKFWIDVKGTIEKPFACSDGLCMKPRRMRKLAGKTCCTTFRVPVEEKDVERIAKIVDEVRQIRDVGAAIERAGGWWEFDEGGAILKDRPSGACVFLSAKKGERPWCTIHEWAVDRGLEFRDYKPETCCLFPLYTLEWGDDVLVTSYSSRYWKKAEPDEAKEIHDFACLHPKKGIGRPLLVEQHDELEYRFGARRWNRVVERLRELGYPV